MVAVIVCFVLIILLCFVLLKMRESFKSTKAQKHFLLLYIFNRPQTKGYYLIKVFESLHLYPNLMVNLRKLEQAGYVSSAFEKDNKYKINIYSCTELGTEAVAKIDRDQVAKEILKIAPEHLKVVVHFGIYGKTGDNISNGETKTTPN